MPSYAGLGVESPFCAITDAEMPPLRRASREAGEAFFSKSACLCDPGVTVGGSVLGVSCAFPLDLGDNGVLWSLWCSCRAL